MSAVPTCPACGAIASTALTRFGRRHECCGLWSWNGKPLADAATHEARRLAHNAFDPLWQMGLLTRREAYALLARELQIDPAGCHMGLMDAATAARVPSAAAGIFEGHRPCGSAS